LVVDNQRVNLEGLCGILRDSHQGDVPFLESTSRKSSCVGISDGITRSQFAAMICAAIALKS
jgi:adenylosuccinate synthase